MEVDKLLLLFLNREWGDDSFGLRDAGCIRNAMRCSNLGHALSTSTRSCVLFEQSQKQAG